MKEKWLVMKALRFGKRLWSVVAAAIMVALSSAPTLAQCAMCRAAFDGANGAKLAKSLNEGIIVLLIPAVMIFCAVFITAIRFRKAPDDLS
jgi:hypothetical protein